MKKLFQRWLLFFVGIAFAMTLGTSYVIHNHLAYKAALEILHLKLADAEHQVRETQENLATVRAMNNTAALAKARAFARIVAADSSVLQRPEDLEQIRQDLDVDELHVSDENGILIASIPEQYRNYNMASGCRRSPVALHTDGVTEAMNPNHEQYSEARLQAFLNQTHASGSEMLTQLRNALAEFANGAEQSDDITLLTLDFHSCHLEQDRP